MRAPQDPVTPSITFDSYVIPETVQSTQHFGAPQAAPRASFAQGREMMLAIGAIATLTFLLGVMAAMSLMDRGQDAAQPVAQFTQSPQTAEAVTRQRAPDLITPSVATPAAQIPALEAAVLQGLQPVRTVGKLTTDEMAERAIEAQAIVSRNKLRMLREGVLAGVYSVKASTDEGNRRLVLTTINAEMTGKSMADLLRQAARDGQISIPASLSTADGDVDMDTMLFNLIQTSLANDGTPEGAAAAKEMSRRAFAASNAKTREVRGERIYVVEPGDSLAYISLQFYGRPGAYLRIFDANREQLSSPDLIKVGQRLIIPS